MTDTIALEESSFGRYDVVYENGMLKREPRELSFVKHNFACFGRSNDDSTSKPEKKEGDLLSFFEQNEVFSTAWTNYIENNNTTTNISNIIIDFNKSTERDFQLGLFDKKIEIKSGVKLDKNTILVKVEIDNQSTEFEFNI